ncbi:MAG: hypothetical protein ACR2MR_05980, partial [Dietzia maris]
IPGGALSSGPTRPDPIAMDREINCPSAGKSVSAYREVGMSASNLVQDCVLDQFVSHLEQPGEAERGADGLSLELGLQALSVVLRIPITDLHLISVPEGLSRVAAVTPDQGN